MKGLFGLLLILATPALADDACHDLWFARNATFDRAGFCFGTALGKAVFDNTGCIGNSVALSTDAAALVVRIREREAEHGCRVDASRTVLELRDLPIRRLLVRQPVRDVFESACLGWLSTPTPLFAGPDAATGAIGEITAGAYVSYAHEAEGGWTYVTTSTPDWTVTSGGWLEVASVEERCTDFAG
ncbi:MAG: DUF4453 domain-containing protein [Silicimonas sp.]|nr:DUF4453 domain-containing protein [Silicimonas sp.]